MTFEHVIPLRFVETLSSPNGGPLHLADHIQQTVARANRIWATAAVEFWIKSVEHHHMPHLHKWIRDKVKLSPLESGSSPTESQGRGRED